MDLLAPEILNLFYQILQNLNLFFLDSPDLHIVLFFPHPGKKRKNPGPVKNKTERD